MERTANIPASRKHAGSFLRIPRALLSVDHKNPGKEKNGLSPFVKLMGKEMTGTAGSTAAKQEAADKKNAVIPFAGKMWKEAEIREPYKQFLEKGESVCM